MSDRRLLETITDSLAANYGIEGSLTRLPGENLNFLVTETDGTKHVLKIVIRGCRRIQASFAANYRKQSREYRVRN
jgi:Ser/Thr protein kinase RdoA (MazF antagonist)